MKTAIRALCWELIWKNRVVFPALALLLAFGAASSVMCAHAAPDVWWASYVRGSVLVAFFASVLLGYALFTLMESHAGWRMNSMTTRWFVLPLRTSLLVVAPMALAFGFTVLLFSAWTPWLKRIVGDLDMTYMLLVFLAGIAAMQLWRGRCPAGRANSGFWPASYLSCFSMWRSCRKTCAAGICGG
jgi:hypothetical protein